MTPVSTILHMTVSVEINGGKKPGSVCGFILYDWHGWMCFDLKHVSVFTPRLKDDFLPLLNIFSTHKFGFSLHAGVRDRKILCIPLGHRAWQWKMCVCVVRLWTTSPFILSYSSCIVVFNRCLLIILAWTPTFIMTGWNGDVNIQSTAVQLRLLVSNTSLHMVLRGCLKGSINHFIKSVHSHLVLSCYSVSSHFLWRSHWW